MLAAVCTLCLFAAQTAPPQFGQLDGPHPRPKQFVTYAPEAQIIPAGKRAVLEIRFRVQEGYHVNSHTPNSELQMPTAVVLGPDATIKLEFAQYPPGKTYALSSDPSEKLDVYSDEFTIKLSVIAQAGTHELHGDLKYQACDHAACYPPKTLPLDVIVIAK